MSFLSIIFPFLRNNNSQATSVTHIENRPLPVNFENNNATLVVGNSTRLRPICTDFKKQIFDTYVFDNDEEIFPCHNYNLIEKRDVKSILSDHVDEIELAKLIMLYMGCDHLFCEKCLQILKSGTWVRMPCKHFIHRTCYDYHSCPRCHETFIN